MSRLDEAIEIIGAVLRRNNVHAEQFILFGSRARGDFQADSDWDIYVLTDRDLAFVERRRLVTEIKRALAQLKIPNDVIFKSAAQFDTLKQFPGHLAYDVAREGIVL